MSRLVLQQRTESGLAEVASGVESLGRPFHLPMEGVVALRRRREITLLDRGCTKLGECAFDRRSHGPNLGLRTREPSLSAHLPCDWRAPRSLLGWLTAGSSSNQ